MGAKEPPDILEQTLSRLLDQIASADQKTAFVLAIDTAMLGVLAALAPVANAWSVLTAIVASVALLALLASVVCLSVATFPRIRGPKGSLIYFGGIVTHSEADYLKKTLSISGSDYLDDIARQCYRNAEIAHTKFTFIKSAMIALFASIVPWLIAIALLYRDK